MSRANARFREADLKRALRAAEAVGAKVTVEVTADGTIRLVPVEAKLDKPAPADDSFQSLINQARHAVRG